MTSKRRNMFYENKEQETTEIGERENSRSGDVGTPPLCESRTKVLIKIPDPDDEEGEIESVHDRYDLDMIVRYPGFNVVPPSHFLEESYFYHAPLMDSSQHINVFISSLKGSTMKNKRTPMPQLQVNVDVKEEVEDMEAEDIPEAIAQAFYERWIPRFGVPLSIIAVQGHQFESKFFTKLTNILGIQYLRTIAYYFQVHHLSSSWFLSVPTLLLGLCGVMREDNKASTAELVYGHKCYFEEGYSPIPNLLKLKQYCNNSGTLSGVCSLLSSTTQGTCAYTESLPEDDCRFVPAPPSELPPPPPPEPDAEGSDSIVTDEENTISSENVQENGYSTPPSLPRSSQMQYEHFGKVKSVYMGTPVYNQHSPYTKVPSYEMFGKGIGDVISFENLPESSGAYEKMNKLIRKVRNTMAEKRHTITGWQMARTDFCRLLLLALVEHATPGNHSTITTPTELYCDHPQSLRLKMASKR
ncbi:hypothetical protein AAG570_000136 [Ranatra chinensis]|uniref:Uncharacterized protein n=1 Tax=Ranatra chinensis TaxID=642074 RepID=A0ABD0ZJI3_9HEMI